MRQVDTYEILKEPLRGQLDNELYNLWNTENYDDVDIITSLLINLGLKNTYNKMKKSILIPVIAFAVIMVFMAGCESRDTTQSLTEQALPTAVPDHASSEPSVGDLHCRQST